MNKIICNFKEGTLRSTDGGFAIYNKEGVAISPSFAEDEIRKACRQILKEDVTAEELSWLLE